MTKIEYSVILPYNTNDTGIFVYNFVFLNKIWDQRKNVTKIYFYSISKGKIIFSSDKFNVKKAKSEAVFYFLSWNDKITHEEILSYCNGLKQGFLINMESLCRYGGLGIYPERFEGFDHTKEFDYFLIEKENI